MRNKLNRKPKPVTRKTLLASAMVVACLFTNALMAQEATQIRLQYPQVADLFNAFDVTQAKSFDGLCHDVAWRRHAHGHGQWPAPQSGSRGTSQAYGNDARQSQPRSGGSSLREQLRHKSSHCGGFQTRQKLRGKTICYLHR